MIRVTLPAHLQTLAGCGPEVRLEAAGPPSVASVLSALEERFPMLRGTLRDQATQKRRPYVRFFACGQDVSNQTSDATLPEAVASGQEPLLILGAIAGG